MNFLIGKSCSGFVCEMRSSWCGHHSSDESCSAPSKARRLIKKESLCLHSIKTALPLGSVGQLQQFGRQLLAAKNTKAALEVFQVNYNKAPDQFITLTGMARGLSANGEYAKALEFANKALPLAPNDAGKQAVQAMVDKLKAGKDIN